MLILISLENIWVCEHCAGSSASCAVYCVRKAKVRVYGMQCSDLWKQMSIPCAATKPDPLPRQRANNWGARAIRAYLRWSNDWEQTWQKGLCNLVRPPSYEVLTEVKVPSPYVWIFKLLLHAWVMDFVCKNLVLQVWKLKRGEVIRFDICPEAWINNLELPII